MPNQAIASRQAAAAPRRAGFTLLEIMLALALSALLLGAVGVAVQVHLRAVETGRVEIEQAQIARAVLDRIADDLRGALQHTTVDTSQLKLMAAASAAVKGNAEALAAAAGAAGIGTPGSSGTGAPSGSSNNPSGNSSSGSTSGGGSPTSPQNSGQSSTGSSKGASGTTGGSPSKSGTTGGTSAGAASGASPTGSSSANPTGSTGSTSPTSSTGDTSTPAPVPGIYGTESQVQVDVSRLPRPDEYGGLVAGAVANSSNAAASGSAMPISVPHDVRTVTYYLNTQAQAASNLAGSGGGLMRRELNRSAALWGSQQGLDPTYDAHNVSLAPEVTALEFRYLDGTEWVTEWDTAASGCLPAAIEVAVTIGMPVDPTANTSLTTTVAAGRQGASELVVRRVIFLPGAGQPTSTGASTSSDASATGDTSSSTSSGTSPSSSAGS